MLKFIVASLFLFGAFASSALAQDTIWSSSTVPANPDAGADNPVNVGVRFQSSVAGTISGIRFYKASTNTGTHIGTLYTDTGTQLAQATFSGESASGWQQVNFTPVSINANTTYVAAYHNTVGHYSQDNEYFESSAYVNSPLTALKDNPSGDRNGVYAYSSSAVFPNQPWESCNYYVDVVFNPASGDTIWSPSTVPTTVDDNDSTNGVNMGVRFQASVAGTISGIRFYKASTNTGTHVGTLYSDTGTQLAQATFTGESASGWQQVNFTPVSISANTTYVAAYFANNGHFSQDDYYFNSAYVNSPLTAMADNPSGDRNGIYAYSTNVVFPNQPWEACNYYVDVVFNPSGGSAPGAPTNLQGTAASVSQINLTWTASTGSPTGYYVYRNGAKVGSPSTNSYSDTGLTAATQYSYYVAAYNSYGTSGDSSTIYVTTQTPAAPTNLQGTAASSSQINLTWTASSGATGYEVFRNGTQVGTPSTNSYSDTGLAASTQYSYYVAATANGSASADSSTIYVTTQSSSGLPANLQNFFPVGPDGQPTANIATWAGRKANTLARMGSGENFTSWNSTANANGMHYIREPDPNNPANDIGNTNLLTWHQSDEPEANGVTAATIVAQYNTWKGIDPNRLVSLNFSGGYLLGLQGSCNASCYAAYLPGGDWLMSDVYPVAGWDSPSNLVAPNNWVGESVALLLSWAPAKPVFQYVECAEDNLSWCPQCPAPTPQQFHSEFWDAIVNGARGVFVFPEAISPFYWDNTTAAMDTQMTADWNTTTALAGVLQTTINPSGMSASVTAPLEAAWRDSGHQYFFVVNTDSNAHNSQTITLTGTGSATQAAVYGESRNVNIVSGVITDNFAANAVHIYQVN
jgi:hypothetical protein